MGHLDDDQRRAADSVDQLRRRVAELERANERLAQRMRARSNPNDHDLLENLGDIIYTTNREGIVLSVNRAVKEVLGFDPDEVIGTPCSRWVCPRDLEKAEAARARAQKGGRTTHRIVIPDKQGVEHCVEISIGPLVIEGQIGGTQGIIRDVTAQQLADRQIREREEKLRALFNAATESILLVDGHGAILALNQTAAKRLGHSAEEMIGRRPTEVAPSLMSPDVAERREAVIRQVFATGEAAYLEDARRGVYFDTSLYPVFGADGTVASVAIFAKDVTKQRKAQEDTRKFKAVFDKTAYGAAITTCSGYLLYVNEALARMHGYEPAELTGRHLSIFHSEDQLPRVNRLNERLVAEGSYVEEEVWHVRRDGTAFPTSMNATVITDDQGRPLFQAAMAIDITERQRAEEEIRSLQRQVEFILGAAKTGLDIIDKELNLRYVDPAWRKIGGPYQGKKCYEYFHGTDRPCPECGLPKALETRQIVTYDSTLPKEGNRPIQVTTIPFPSKEGEWLVAEVNVDIAERKQLEQRLRESEERYRTLVETAGETIAVVDAQGVFHFLNTVAARRLGGCPTDFIGKTMWDLFPQEVAEEQMAHIRRVIEAGQGENLITLTNVRGELRWYNTTVVPVRDGAGHVTAGLVIARDIHELRTAQQELEAYREKMIHAERLASLGTLSAMLSHEMTQPLTVLRLSLQNALRTLEDAPPPATVLDDLQDALAEIGQVSAIVQRFRDFARRTSDEAVGVVSLAAVADKVLPLLEESARKARVTLEVRQLEDLPPVRACGKDIEQIFFALAQNAIHASDGLRDHRFRITGAQRDGSVELQFVDDCGGIPPEIVARLFEPFFTTKPLGLGTGLGLCVVERMVSQAGGHLRVDSQWGKGTTFFLSLPINPAASKGSGEDGEIPWTA